MVLAIDERSQIQGLDRTRPILPGTPERSTYDYERQRTISLDAASGRQAGEVVGALDQRHRAISFARGFGCVGTARLTVSSSRCPPCVACSSRCPLGRGVKERSDGTET